MTKLIKKILISILILYMCISPLFNISSNSFATEVGINNGNTISNEVGEYVSPGITVTPPTFTPIPTITPIQTATPTPAREGITREQVYSDADSRTTGFKYYIHVGNVTYTHYYQVRGFYKDDYIPAWDSTICNSGCGMTSCSILLSGYGVTLNPRQVLQESNGSFGISTTLSRHGVTRNLV